MTLDRPRVRVCAYGWLRSCVIKEVREKAFDQGALVTLLTESHRDSYRVSSLKVRRRYRKLIVVLTQAKQVVAAEASTRKRASGGDWGD